MGHVRDEADDDPCSDKRTKNFDNDEKGMDQSQGLHCLNIENNL